MIVRNGTEEEYENSKKELFQAENDRINYKTYPEKFNNQP
jgi:hypothetical protein